MASTRVDTSASSAIRRFRIAMGLFIAGLVASGVTAFPLLHEIELLTNTLGIDPAGANPAIATWLLTVRHGLEETHRLYPWLAYGTDWLGFAHLVIALFFIAPLIDPPSSRPNIIAGLIACAGVIPIALICGAIRGIPFAHRLVDCSFGVIGGALLLYCLRLLPRIEPAGALSSPHRRASDKS
jgi:hypothetical protein